VKRVYDDLNLLEVRDFIENKGYQYYYEGSYHLEPRVGSNCSDEICLGSNERKRKIINLMHKRVKIGEDNFMKQWEDIVKEIHSLLTEEVMALLGCSERKAHLWLDYHVDFNHVKQHVDTAGNKYLSVDPIMKLGEEHDYEMPKM